MAQSKASAAPTEVILQKSVWYEEFVDFIGTDGLDLSGQEKDSLGEANTNAKQGLVEKFVNLEDLEKELGILYGLSSFIAAWPATLARCRVTTLVLQVTAGTLKRRYTSMPLTLVTTFTKP